MKTRTNNLKLDQSGVVSFISVMLLSIVLIMITLSFVKASTSNLREALDNQLATQAFYAAESGVNDALSALRGGGVFNGMDNGECGAFMQDIKDRKAGASNFNQLVPTGPISYSCVLVDSTLPNITFMPGSNGKIYIIKSGTKDAAGNIIPIQSIKISWGLAGQTPFNSTGVELPIKNSSLTSGSEALSMLRVSFYYPYLNNPIDDPATADVDESTILTRSNLINSQKTFYLKPVDSTGSSSMEIDSLTLPDGSVVPVKCDVGGCSLVIKNISTIDARNDGFYLRTVPLYNSNTGNVIIEGYSDNIAGNNIDLIDAQYSIDVTARGGDVYKRVDYRFSKNPQFDVPTTASMSGGGADGDLCKQFVVWPGANGYVNEAGCSF